MLSAIFFLSIYFYFKFFNQNLIMCTFFLNINFKKISFIIKKYIVLIVSQYILMCGSKKNQKLFEVSLK